MCAFVPIIDIEPGWAAGILPLLISSTDAVYPDQATPVELSDYHRKTVALYFYLKKDGLHSGFCTTEAWSVPRQLRQTSKGGYRVARMQCRRT